MKTEFDNQVEKMLTDMGYTLKFTGNFDDRNAGGNY